MDRAVLRRIAKRIVSDCLGISRNEKILIWGAVYNLSLVEDIVVEIYKVGGFPVLKINWDNLTKRLLTEVPSPHLSAVPRVFENTILEFDGFIHVENIEDWRVYDSLPKEKVAKLKEAYPKNCKSAYIAFPFQQKAELFGCDYAEYEDAFLRALDCDPSELSSDLTLTLRSVPSEYSKDP